MNSIMHTLENCSKPILRDIIKIFYNHIEETLEDLSDIHDLRLTTMRIIHEATMRDSHRQKKVEAAMQQRDLAAFAVVTGMQRCQEQVANTASGKEQVQAKGFLQQTGAPKHSFSFHSRTSGKGQTKGLLQLPQDILSLTVNFLSLEKMRLQRTMTCHSRAVLGCCFTPDGSSMLSCGADGLVKTWDAATRGMTQTAVLEKCALACFSSDGKFVLGASDSDFSLKLWRLPDRGIIASHERLEAKVLSTALFVGHSDIILSCCVAPFGGKTVLSGSRDGLIKMWSTEAGLEIGSCRHTIDMTEEQDAGDMFVDCVHCLCFAPDGMSFLGGFESSQMRLWDATTCELLLTLPSTSASSTKPHVFVHTGAVLSCSFSSDGAKIVSGSEDMLMNVWGVATGELLVTLAGHSFGINHCCFSPNDKTIASISNHQTLMLWNTATGHLQQQVLELNHGSATMSAFSADGKRLLVAYTNGRMSDFLEPSA
jgi:WD40 repeat protein